MSRQYLNHVDVDENINLWQSMVQEQTGKPFALKGAALCGAEESLEALVAAPGGGDWWDAIGDTFVATTTVLHVVLKDCGGVVTLEPGPRPAFKDLLLDFALTCVNIARKGMGASKGDKEYWSRFVNTAAQVRAGCMEQSMHHTDRWYGVINPVLDILDQRLVNGYVMSAEGSAIKTEDQG